MAQHIYSGQGPPQLVGIEAFEPTDAGYAAMDVVMENIANASNVEPTEGAPTTPSKRKSSRVAAQVNPVTDKPKSKRGRKPKNVEKPKTTEEINVPGAVEEPMEIHVATPSYKFTPETAQFYEERLKAEIWALRHYGPSILQNLSEEVPHHPVTHIHHKIAVGKLGVSEHSEQHQPTELSYIAKEVGSEPVQNTLQTAVATLSQ